MPRDRGEAKVGRRPRELAKQVLDVRLLTGALTAEHVGVDDDHATSSYTATVEAATSAQLAKWRGAGFVAASMPAWIDWMSSGSTYVASAPASSCIGDPELVT